MSYIGAEPDGMGKAQRFTFTASGGETTVTADDDGIPIGYTAGQVSVYLNGVKLVVGTDCVATNGSTITGLAALAASDVVEVVALSIFSATTVEGTALISTGETGGSKFLREDGDGTSSWQTVTEYNDDVVQTNIALLGFKVAVNGSLAKYDLKDQIVDEFVDATGVNTGDSTNETLTSGVYSGIAPLTPTVTENADSDPVVHGDYTYYKWTTVTTSGSYVTNTTQDHEYLVVGGGGAGGSGGLNEGGGGGGAGGYLAATGKSLVGGTTYTITVGVGGAGAGSSHGAPGGLSSLVGSDITDIIAAGGGYGATEMVNHNAGATGGDGGSGGGSSAYFTSGSGSGTAGPPRQGNDGGTGYGSSSWGGGGGGGHAAVGANATSSDAGNGGAGTNNDIGVSSGTVGYAGGGGAGLSGGGSYGTASHGGGRGAAAGGGQQSASVNTGGGGGGASGGLANAGGAGGSGTVILRRLTSASTIGDLTLQSSDTTAEAAPTKADMVMLIEDAGSGVGTVNTHIKGWVSMYETGGTKTWTQGTLVDEGDWGSDKRILAFHDLTLTGTSGTQMAYKITTHSASAVYDTRIHATSIGWR